MLHVEARSGVLLWTIDRPGAKNALDYATLGALAGAVRQAASDREVRAAIVTGAGGAFASGGDLRELRDRCSASDAEELSDAGYALTSAIADAPFPVIAALPGPAIGGGAELALACDLRVADATARLAFKQVRMGITTAWGSVPRLVALVGAGTAARLLFTAQEIDAVEARRLGLVDEVAEDGRSLEVALAWASEIARGSPRAITETKRLLRQALSSERDARQAERRAFVETWCRPDHREAVEAYFERRAPRWLPR